MAWLTGSRITHFREVLLPRTLRLRWVGTEEEFTETLLQSIERVSNPKIKEVLERFYVEGDTQERDERTRRPSTVDGRYYQLLERGREALALYLEQSGKARRLEENDHE